MGKSGDTFIERLSMYNQWFNMDIAKWIYNLGFWTGNVEQFMI